MVSLLHIFEVHEADLLSQVAVNQLTFTPLFNSYFFGMQSLLTGMTVPETIERIKNTVPVSWINSCKLWPAVTAFMFAFVPIEYRSIFGGVIAIGWQTYLSILNQRAAAGEELEHSPEDTKPRAIRQEKNGETDKAKCAA
jgi:protein Mpv17